MISKKLPDEMEARAIVMLALFRDELNGLIGKSLCDYKLDCILQSENGPTFEMYGRSATVYVGPNATNYEPSFVANLAHESTHLHVHKGVRGNASGLEEGFALYFELSRIEAEYGKDEREYFEEHLPTNYSKCLKDFQLLIESYPQAVQLTIKTYGKLTGPTSLQLKSRFPKINWSRCYRLARRKRMRP